MVSASRDRVVPPRPPLRATLKYAIALLIVLLALALRAVPHRVVDAGSSFLVFYPAIFAAALYLGARPAFLALLIAVPAVVLLFPTPDGWLSIADITDLSLFVVLSSGFILLIAAHQAARRKLEIHARALEHEVAERRRAEEALRRSNEDLEEFSHAVSHDLKEPLRGIALTAEFLYEDYGSIVGEDGRKKLRRLIQLPRQMADQLSALLEYSRLGRSDLALAPADMAEVVAAATAPLSPWLDQRSATVALVTPLPTVRCDRPRVVQAIANLITNAVKYNDSPAPHVEIGALATGPAPVFFVRDNGIGIPPDRADQVFRMFRRQHGPDEYGGGSGSGLALSKRTIERHGGRIWYESAPGRGTTFYFTLQPDPPPPVSPHIDYAAAAH